MNFSFVPSLQSMAAIKIVTLLWNGADVITLIAECDEHYYRGWHWREIEKQVNKKISLLRQPAPLREKLSSFVMQIGDQIRRWKDIHFQRFPFENIPREFCWTSLGTVDKKGTAEAFVHDLTLPEGERYCMACLYCIEWHEPVPFDPTSESLSLSEFEAYRTYDATGNATALRYRLVDDTESPYQSAFRFAVLYGNPVAAEYYLQKLTPREKEQSLCGVELPNQYVDFDFFRFLLRHMNEGQQSRLFQKHAEYVLECLLEWPWQELFMNMACHVRENLNRREYSRLLSEIVEKIDDGSNDYSYRELFRAFWLQIPVDHKKEIMRDSDLWSYLIRVRDEKNVSIMLKDMSPEEKEQILFSQEGIRTCEILAHHHEWDALESFIVECITSRDKMIHFKEKCEEERNHSFFPFLDELIQKCSENRGGEEADCPTLKTLCSSSGVSKV